MKTVIFNVGGALSAYIETPVKKIVIDLGGSSDFSPVFDFLIPLYEKRKEKKVEKKYKIDQLILSHPHADHISELINLDSNFYVDLYTTPNDLSPEAESRKNVNWDLIPNSDGDYVKKLRAMYKGRSLPLKVCEPSRMTIGYIYPKDIESDTTLKNESYPNNISITTFIRSGYSIFFAADIQKEGMKRLLKDNSSLKKELNQGVDFLVCPHHGLRSSFSTNLFDEIKNRKTKKLNIVSEKSTNGEGDARQVDDRYSSTEYCEGDNNLSTNGSTVCQRKTSNGHIFIDNDGTLIIDNDIQSIIDKF